MSEAELTQAFLIDGQVYVRQTDGSLRPGAGKTDFARLAAITEADNSSRRV